MYKTFKVNGTDMAGISHVDAVDVLKSITDRCHLVVSREVLIVLPEDIASPPPGGKAGNSGDKTPSPPEDQSDKIKTPPPTQSDNVSSPPPEEQVNKPSPPPEDQASKISPPPQDQTNTDTVETNTLTVMPVVESKSMEEMRTFGEELSQVANAAHDNEVVVEQVDEHLLESAPKLEDLPSDNTVDQQQVEVKEEDQTTVKTDDVSALEEFAEQLRKSKEDE